MDVHAFDTPVFDIQVFDIVSLILRYFVSALRYSSAYRIEAPFSVPHGDTVLSTTWRYSSVYYMEVKTM